MANMIAEHPLRSVLRYHRNAQAEALRRSRHPLNSHETCEGWKMEADLHRMLADKVEQALPPPPGPVAGLLAAALVDAGMTGTAAEATALQLLEDFRVEPRR